MKVLLTKNQINTLLTTIEETQHPTMYFDRRYFGGRHCKYGEAMKAKYDAYMVDRMERLSKYLGGLTKAQRGKLLNEIR